METYATAACFYRVGHIRFKIADVPATVASYGKNESGKHGA